MNKKFIIDDQEMEFKASAGTPILYKQLFKKDILIELDRITKLKSKVEQGKEMNELVPELAFIMWAEGNFPNTELFKKLSFESYIEWLLGIDPDGIRNHSAEFIALYRGNMATASQPKN